MTSGSICVDGVDIRDVKQADLRSRIGYVPQKGLLLSGDIESNLLYSKKDANEKDIESALSISQSTEFVSKNQKASTVKSVRVAQTYREDKDKDYRLHVPLCVSLKSIFLMIALVH